MPPPSCSCLLLPVAQQRNLAFMLACSIKTQSCVLTLPTPPPAICVLFRPACSPRLIPACRIINAYSYMGQRTDAPRIAS